MSLNQKAIDLMQKLDEFYPGKYSNFQKETMVKFIAKNPVGDIEPVFKKLAEENSFPPMIPEIASALNWQKEREINAGSVYQLDRKCPVCGGWKGKDGCCLSCYFDMAYADEEEMVIDWKMRKGFFVTGEERERAKDRAIKMMDEIREKIGNLAKSKNVRKMSTCPDCGSTLPSNPNGTCPACGINRR
jgi:rubrerythrin